MTCHGRTVTARNPGWADVLARAALAGL